MKDFIGKKVELDVINKYGVTIVPAQTILNHEAIKLLISHGMDINDINTAIPNSAVNVIVPSSQIIKQTVSKSKELFESITSSRKVPLMEIRKEILPSIQEISKNSNIFELFESVKAKDDYTYEHNIGVGILSTLIGRWMNLNEAELSILSLAATLHDVGKVNIPIEILNKPGKLTDKEFEIVKKHTIFGYEILKETTGLSPKIARVALQHHEREDGRGYPLGLKKGNIDLLSSIVAVADVFHAMSSKRPYHEPIPFHEIVSQMGHGKFGELNPQIVSLFLENIMKKTVGKQVILTDGRMGEVVLLNPHRMETPLIKVADDFIDLSKEEGLHIREIIA
ncbi:HD-GYP domain-containing protein [Paenibacillus sp. FA6]|uniref:HD-GYP domain-containing protein n=1 Tax=Paenibacillus sp. FA6 TaxID=3413029 RepID=UPI003F65DC0C